MIENRVNPLPAAGPRPGALDVWRAALWFVRAQMNWLPRFALPAAGGQDPERVLVLIDGPNPSFDYYLAPRLQATSGQNKVEIIDTRTADPAIVDPAGAFVVLCRFLPRRWQVWLQGHEKAVAGIGLFLDDDLPALVRDHESPFFYRMRVASRGLGAWGYLSRRLNVLWVSTPHLARMFSAASPTVIGPVASSPDFAQARPRAGAIKRIAFHATEAHRADHVFAAEICRLLEQRRDDFIFDVRAGPRLAAMWDGRRAEVVPPIHWHGYRAFASTCAMDVMIAPLGATPANAARSPSKAIDAVRFGAAGLFADAPAYEALRGAAPMLASDPEVWRQQIETLLDDTQARENAADALRARVMSWTEAAGPLFPLPGRRGASVK